MKKSMLMLGLVLSLSLIGSMQAQMRVYNANLLKFGDVNTSPTLGIGMEIDMPHFLFRGRSAKFVINGATIEIKSNSDSVPHRKIDLPISETVVRGPATSIVFDDKVSMANMSSPLYSVYADNLYSSRSIATTSDRRYKTNIEDLSPALDKIMQLRPIRFDYRKEKDGVIDSTHMNCVGLIAQELKEVVPEAVQYLYDDDIYMVDYTTLIPFLIKTVQEQQARIDEQQVQIEELQAVIWPSETSANVEASAQNNIIAATPSVINENKLWSNTPNPFKQETHIRYALTNDVQNAQLCIYNLNGEQIACHRLSNRGQNDFTLSANSLRPGIYLYSLIADGQVVDTHRMVVTE